MGPKSLGTAARFLGLLHSCLSPVSSLSSSVPSSLPSRSVEKLASLQASLAERALQQADDSLETRAPQGDLQQLLDDSALVLADQVMGSVEESDVHPPRLVQGPHSSGPFHLRGHTPSGQGQAAKDPRRGERVRRDSTWNAAAAHDDDDGHESDGGPRSLGGRSFDSGGERAKRADTPDPRNLAGFAASSAARNPTAAAAGPAAAGPTTIPGTMVMPRRPLQDPQRRNPRRLTRGSGESSSAEQTSGAERARPGPRTGENPAMGEEGMNPCLSNEPGNPS